MNLFFTYIEGINRENTLDFDSDDISGARDHYFSRLPTTKMITEAFYPPYYRNSIKVDRNDIDFTSKINYMYFEFDGRNYYYFIEDIEYINEDVIQINVEMDTIVTYCDVMKVHGGLINRRFINRFNENLINRKYIRENLSNGIFNISKRIINDPREYQNSVNSGIKGYFIIRLSDDPWYDEDNKPYSFSNSAREKNDILGDVEYNNQYFYYLFPDLGEYNDVNTKWTLPNGDIINNYTENKWVFKSISTTLQIFSRMSANDVLAIYYVPLDIMSNYITCSLDDAKNGIIRVNQKYMTRRYSRLTSEGDGKLPQYLDCVCLAWVDEMASKTPTKQYIKIEDFNYTIPKYTIKVDNIVTKNSSIGTKFLPEYIPAMFDNNYYYITFGLSNYFTTFDGYYSKHTSITFEITSTLQGNLIFTSALNNNVYDKIGYDTIVMSNDANTLDLCYDNWENYVTYNKYSISSALAKDVLNLGVSLATAGMNTAAYTALYSTQRTKKRGLLSKKAQRQIAFTKAQEEISDVKSSADFLGNIIDVSTHVANLKASPEKGVDLGISASLISGIAYPSLIKYKVQDYNQVAQYYHRYGYRVDEYVDNVDNIFAYCRNRYYFNYIKFIDCDIDLTTLCANSIIEDIEQRFSDGIRYWKIHDLWTPTPKTYIGDYQYDNVELDNLKQ